MNSGFYIEIACYGKVKNRRAFDIQIFSSSK